MGTLLFIGTLLVVGYLNGSPPRDCAPRLKNGPFQPIFPLARASSTPATPRCPPRDSYPQLPKFPDRVFSGRTARPARKVPHGPVWKYTVTSPYGKSVSPAIPEKY